MSAILANDSDVRKQTEISGAPNFSKEEESNRLSYVYIVLKRGMQGLGSTKILATKWLLSW